MNNGLDDHVVLNVTLLLFRIDYWLARCKIKATLIISRHVCQSVCLCVFVRNFDANNIGN